MATMRRALLPVLALQALLSVAALRSMQPGSRYAHAVYHVHIAEIHPGSPTGPDEYDEWYDPAGKAFRADYVYAGTFFRQSLQGGRLYWTDGGGSSAHEAAPNAYSIMAGHWSGAIGAALLGSGDYYALHASGPDSRVQLAGRAAVRSRVSDPDVPGGTCTVWLDPRTRTPMRADWFATPTSPVQWRFSAPRLIRPGVLPADFLAPPHPSGWDQIGAWLAAHIPLRVGA